MQKHLRLFDRHGNTANIDQTALIIPLKLEIIEINYLFRVESPLETQGGRPIVV